MLKLRHFPFAKLQLHRLLLTGFIHNTSLPVDVAGALFQRFVVVVEKLVSCWTVPLALVERVASCLIAPVQNEIFTLYILVHRVS